MFQNFLVPLDLVDHETVLVAVETLATGRKVSVTLLHVIEEIAGLEDDEELQTFYRRLEERATARLELARGRLVESGLEVVQVLVTYGHRAPEILRAAATHEVDLIVMDSRPVDLEMVEKSWPTVSHQVALTSTVPVLLAR